MSAVVLGASLAYACAACSNLAGLDHYIPCSHCSVESASGSAEQDASGQDATTESTVTEEEAEAAADATTTDVALADQSSGSADGSALVGEAAARDAAADANARDGVSPAPDATGDVNTPDSPVDAPTEAGSTLGMGLVVYYTFDETSGTTAADSSGNGHDATLAGGATFTAGMVNNAVTLDATNHQYVSLPNNILGGLTSFSVSAWVNLGSAPMWSRIFDFGTGTSVYTFFTPNAGSACRFAITTGSSPGEQQVAGTALLPTGSWQHVAVTLSNGTATLYVQGVEVGHNPGVSLTAASLGNTTQNWLGRSQFTPDPYLTGQIDNFRIYSRGLTAAEVQALYSSKL